MSNLPHAGNVEMLRSDLGHFEESGNVGLDLMVMEIKAHLLRRIAQLEVALRRINALAFATYQVPSEDV